MVGEPEIQRRMIDPQSRTHILDRVKAALRVNGNADRTEECRAEWSELARPYDRVERLDPAARVQLFDERLRHYNGTPFYGTDDTKSDVAHVLAQRMRRILIVPSHFPAEWLPDGFLFVPDENLSNDQLASNDGVLTTCTLGIALTGTVVLESSPQQGRRAATLVPDYHLCVLRAQDIVELVPEAIRKLQAIGDRPLTFLSGPSATVDIEMTRVRGVHGPRTLDVLIV